MAKEIEIGEFQVLEEKIRKYMPSADLSMVEKAYSTATEMHIGQKRVSGEPFVTHPIEVAKIIADMELDLESVTAALLHDVVEDTDYTIEDIKREFNDNVALLVDGVTKLSKIPYSSKEEHQIESLRKMFFAMAKDVRVILIKLADRLHNLRTMKSMPEETQRQKARETLEVYAPLAHRLGMSKIQCELEDLSLKYIDPIGYYEIIDKIAQKRSEREQYINDIIEILKKRLDEDNIHYQINGRAKHFYSIYRKMFTQNKSIDDIYDLFAVRIIVDTVSDCYAVLGMVHDLFNPVPGRFKDYIAMPKPNMYQSLHSTMFGPNGTPFEIQIRTWEMHNTAENGIAAHWKYKEGKSGQSDLDSKLAWIKNFLEIQKDTTDADDFMHTLKIDLFSDEVFVFTPRGDVVNLPAGSTPIDFAYSIHSAVGNSMTGAKVNGKIVTLDYHLNNGDIVEVIKGAANHGPNLDWLKIAKTSQARNKINQWFKKENREENIVKGKEIMERELKKVHVDISILNDEKFVAPLLKRYGFKQLDDVYSTLGYGGASATKFLAKIKNARDGQLPDIEAPALGDLVSSKPSKPTSNSGVIVEGVENCLVRFSHCCNPVPGDDIVGYITRGRGVAIHRRDCVNITHDLQGMEADRFIKVSWDMGADSNYQTLLCVTATDREMLIVDTTLALKENNAIIKNYNARTAKNGIAIIDIVIEISSTAQLEKIMKSLKKINGVLSVVRRRQG